MSSYRIVGLAGHFIYRVERLKPVWWSPLTPRWVPITEFVLDMTGEDGYDQPREFGCYADALCCMQEHQRIDFENDMRDIKAWTVIK